MTIERLDYSKPPPGYAIQLDEDWSEDGWWCWDVNGRYVDYTYGKTNTLNSAWQHYKHHNDPPGMWTLLGENTFWWGHKAEAAFGSAASQAEARAAAWSWHDRRHALDSEEHWIGAAAPGVLIETFWPRCLTWSEEQVAEVERWLVDSTAEMPEVLRDPPTP